MEHSRLLKYILPEGHNHNKNKMAEPVKIQFEYQNPTNVEAEVPGEQKVREGPEEEGEVISQTSENTVSSYTEVHSEIMEDGTLNSKHTSTNENSEKDSKNDKKKTRIPVSKFRQAVETVKAERAETMKKEPESHIPKRRSSIPKLKRDSKKPVKKELTITTTEITETVTARDDEFDKLYEEVVCNTPTAVDINVSLLNPKVDDPEKVESKFEEIIHDYDENKVQPIDVDKVRRSKIPFLKRRSQPDIDCKTQAERSSRIFIARDKLRQRHSSNSEQYDVRTELKDVSDNNKVSNGMKQEPIKDDKQFEQGDAILDPTKSNAEVITKHTKTIIETSSKENEQDNLLKMVGTTTVIEITTNENSDKVQKKQGQVVEENIYKDSIKIGIPVFESYVHEYTEKNEIEKTIEVTNVLSYASKNESDFKIDKTDIKVETLELKDEPHTIIKQEIVDISDMSTEKKSEEMVSTEKIELEAKDNDINQSQINEILDINVNVSPNINANETVSKAQKYMENTKQVMKETDGSMEDIAKLGGKVGKLISKIDSHQSGVSKNDYTLELPKNKLVLSKIAMFERHEVEPASKKTNLYKNYKLPKLLTKEIKRVENTHIHTPLIVDEVFKPFEVTINNNVAGNNAGITTNGDGDVQENITSKIVVIESPEIVHYDEENKLLNHSNTLFIEQSKVEEEILKPNPIKYKDETKTNNRDEISKGVDVPVIIPKFVPVREVLKRYESLNEPKDETRNREVLDSSRHSKEIIAKTRPITDLKPEKAYKFHEQHIVKPKNEIISDFNPYNDHNKSDVDDEVFVETTEQPITNNGAQPVHNFDGKDNFEKVTITRIREFKSYKSRRDDDFMTFKSLDVGLKTLKSRDNDDDDRRAKSLAELDLGDAVKGKVNRLIVRMNSVDKIEVETKETRIHIKEMPMKRSVSAKIALFERKLTPARAEILPPRLHKLRTDLKSAERSAEVTQAQAENTRAETNKTEDVAALTEDIQKKIEELTNAKLTYGKMNVPVMELSNGQLMPVLALGTALLDPRIAFYVITAAIDLGYRAIDTAFIYGNEQTVGEAVRAKIADGTVTREELFIISKLWSTYHRTDLVRKACQASLDAMGLEYFDLYLIHNPMSFKEDGAPIPKIATVLQYSEYEYLDAWFGMEALGGKARSIGVSNFNSVQLKRVLDRARIKPVVNQVECHPLLSQQKLHLFCSDHNISLSCFGVLGSKGTPLEYKSGHQPVIDDALVQVMAAGLGVSPAQLLIRYQIECGHSVVVKASSAAHLWDNLQALTFTLTPGQVDALHALNRNKRTFTFRGMGDTHKNYPFNVAF